MATIWAKIKNDTVVNIQMCEVGDIFDSNFTWVDLGNNPDNVSVGWKYDGNTFSLPS